MTPLSPPLQQRRYAPLRKKCFESAGGDLRVGKTGAPTGPPVHRTPPPPPPASAKPADTEKLCGNERSTPFSCAAGKKSDLFVLPEVIKKLLDLEAFTKPVRDPNTTCINLTRSAIRPRHSGLNTKDAATTTPPAPGSSRPKPTSTPAALRRPRPVRPPASEIFLKGAPKKEGLFPDARDQTKLFREPLPQQDGPPQGRESLARLAYTGKLKDRIKLACSENLEVALSIVAGPAFPETAALKVAENPKTSGAVLAFMAESPRYKRNQQIIHSLLQNPKTPLHATLPLLNHVSPMALQNLLRIHDLPKPLKQRIEYLVQHKRRKRTK